MPLEDEPANRQKVFEIFLVKQPRRCANVYELAKAAKVHWLTAERELQRMEREGRVHGEIIGNSKVYFLNGKGEWQDKVNLSSKHTLFLDTFISPFGERFIRIKETKKSEDGKWEAIGNVIVTPDKLAEFTEKVTRLKDKIESVQKGVQ